jgi:hypothetical protein
MRLTDVMIQMDLTDIYRTFHSNTKENTFSSPHRIFSKTDHIISHKASLNRYKKIEINLDFNGNRNHRKPTYSWKLINSLLNDHYVREEVKKESKDFLEFNENQGITNPNLWATMKTVLRGKLIASSTFIKKLESSHTNELKVHLKTLENKTEGNTLRRSRRQEINPGLKSIN